MIGFTLICLCVISVSIPINKSDEVNNQIKLKHIFVKGNNSTNNYQNNEKSFPDNSRYMFDGLNFENETLVFLNLDINDSYVFNNCNLIIGGNITVENDSSLIFNNCHIFFNFTLFPSNYSNYHYYVFTHYISNFGDISLGDSYLELQKFPSSIWRHVTHNVKIISYNFSTLLLSNSTVDFVSAENLLILEIGKDDPISSLFQTPITSINSTLSILSCYIATHLTLLKASSSQVLLENNSISFDEIWLQILPDFDSVFNCIVVEGYGRYNFYGNFIETKFRASSILGQIHSIFGIYDANYIELERNFIKLAENSYVNITGESVIHVQNNIICDTTIKLWNPKITKAIWSMNIFSHSNFSFPDDPDYYNITIIKNNFVHIDFYSIGNILFRSQKVEKLIQNSIVNNYHENQDNQDDKFEVTWALELNTDDYLSQNEVGWYNFYTISMLINPIDEDGDNFYDLYYLGDNYRSRAAVKPYELISEIDLNNDNKPSLLQSNHSPQRPKQPHEFYTTKIAFTAIVNGTNLATVVLSLESINGILSIPMKQDSTIQSSYFQAIGYSVINFTSTSIKYRITVYDIYGNYNESNWKQIIFQINETETTNDSAVTMLFLITYVFVAKFLEKKQAK